MNFYFIYFAQKIWAIQIKSDEKKENPLYLWLDESNHTDA